MATLTQKYRTFFDNDLFVLIDYTNGLAHFRAQSTEEGFMCYYDIISSISDDNLEVLEEEFGQPFTYNIDEIYGLTDYIVEINQHDVFTIKADTLFSSVNRRNEQKI